MKTESTGFGTRYIFGNGGRVLKINRNYALRSIAVYPDLPGGYHLSGGGDFSVALSDEDMLDLFRAYLRMREEYETGVENGESI